MNSYRTIFRTLAGSQLYGTNTPESDIDYRGVVMEPLPTVMGLQNFEQFESKEQDEVLYGLRKFINLCLDGNPNIIEILFAPTNGNTCLAAEYEWGLIQTNRHLMLAKSRIVSAYLGYATQQKKRMETHYRWLNGEPPKQAKPDDFGGELKADGSGYRWPNNERQNAYANAHKTWTQYQEWIKNRNPKRHALEVQYGADTKHMMHLFRLYTECLDLLEKGYLEFPLPNKRWLMEIRNGALHYDEALALADKMEAEIKEAETVSDRLANKPDYVKINVMVMQLEFDNITREHSFYGIY